MITKHDLEYVGHESMDDYFEAICQELEQNNHSTAQEMEAKLSRGQLLAFEQYIDEAYHYELKDNL
jgi:paraquat-inducible protein B